MHALEYIVTFIKYFFVYLFTLALIPGVNSQLMDLVIGGTNCIKLFLFERFIVGFFLAAIPWYVGAFILLCVRVDYREKPGYVACTIAVSKSIWFQILLEYLLDFLWLFFLYLLRKVVRLPIWLFSFSFRYWKTHRKGCVMHSEIWCYYGHWCLSNGLWVSGD